MIKTKRTAFTLIELLVVVAIIALLIAILVPSLSSARAEARTVACASNLHHIGQAAAIYLTRDRVYPVSYAYVSEDGSVDVSPAVQQSLSGDQRRYCHWSYFLYGNGQVSENAFQCPAFDSGGVPRTNPGPKQSSWEAGQIDAYSKTGPNDVEDLQAPRIAYTANAAVMPRNKFTPAMTNGGGRVNKFANDSAIKSPSQVIMATEFNNSWRAIALQQGNEYLSKSHRPINPFYSSTSGWDEYSASEPRGVGRMPFTLGDPNAGTPFGLLPASEIANQPGLIADSTINAVGRHHPGGDKKFGGTANFLYVDSHVERKTVLETLNKFEWGSRYYTLSGSNSVAKNQFRLASGG